MKIDCPTCGEAHDLSDMDMSFARPDAYFAVRPSRREERWVLNPDLAALDGERFFVRGLVELPVRGGEHPFRWGAWARVSEAAFRRYEALWDDPERDREPPFVGALASQLPGYPQTLGLPVTVRLGGGTRRPTFTVDDAAHPLAAEQRQGVYLERVLEILFPVLHRDAVPPLGAPRMATLEEDRWRLLDAVDAVASRAHGAPYWMPDDETRGSLRTGDAAKLLFEIEASDEDGRAARHVERMWVEVDHRRGEGDEPPFSGTLANAAFNPGLTRRGMRVWFGPRHVVDVQSGPDGPMASDAAPVHCRAHGPSFPCYLCGHLASGEGKGFHTGEDPGNPRPDAWCDACEAVLEREGEWNERSEAHADVTLVCGGCYDAAEESSRSD